ncbi:MAG TPA: polyisoprenoid-binding protein [Flavobacteriales bacterium]|jgi:polyisoprenoid-binding protein YceI|nr:polyisoprenoid-binding protein [Flavobacteriales bacterium]
MPIISEIELKIGGSVLMTTKLDVVKKIALFYLLFICTLLLSCNVEGQVASWKIIDNCTIKFTGTKAEGTFTGLSGQIVFDPRNLAESKFDVELDAASISTGNETKDKHARGESWFYTENFPKVYFTSDEIRPTKDGYETVGVLEMRGIKKAATISFSFSQKGDQGIFSGVMNVNREDYGIEGNFFAFIVGEEFEVTLQVITTKI